MLQLRLILYRNFLPYVKSRNLFVVKKRDEYRRAFILIIVSAEAKQCITACR